MNPFSVIQKYLAKIVFDYTIPTDAKTQFWDWYCLYTMLSAEGLGNPDNLKISEAYQTDAIKAFAALTQQQLMKFKRDLPIVVAAEMTYSFRGSSNVDKIKSKFGEKGKLVYNAINGDPVHDKFYKPGHDYAENIATYNSTQPVIYHALRVAFPGDMYGAMKFCEWCFAHLNFSGGYGGKPWAAIAEAAAEVQKAQFTTTGNGMPSYDLIKLLDHCWDLEHNNGTAFNKISTFGDKGGSHSWIKGSCNLRSVVGDSAHFLGKVSSKLEGLLKWWINFRYRHKIDEGQFNVGVKEGFANAWLMLMFDNASKGKFENPLDLSTKVEHTFDGLVEELNFTYKVSVDPIVASYTGEKKFDRATATSTSTVKLVIKGGTITFDVYLNGSRYKKFVFRPTDMKSGEGDEAIISFKEGGGKLVDIKVPLTNTSFGTDIVLPLAGNIFGEKAMPVYGLGVETPLIDYDKIKEKPAPSAPQPSPSTSEEISQSSEVVSKTITFNGMDFSGTTHQNGGGFVSSDSSVSSSTFVSSDSFILNSVQIGSGCKIVSSVIGIDDSANTHAYDVTVTSSEISNSTVVKHTGESNIAISSSTFNSAVVSSSEVVSSLINDSTVVSSNIKDSDVSTSELKKVNSSRGSIEGSVVEGVTIAGKSGAKVTIRKSEVVCTGNAKITQSAVIENAKISGSGHLIQGKILGGTWTSDKMVVPSTMTLKEGDTLKKKPMHHPGAPIAIPSDKTIAENPDVYGKAE